MERRTMIRCGINILVAIALAVELIAVPHFIAVADNPPTAPSISNIGVGVSGGIVTFHLCVLPGTEPGVGAPIGGGVVINPTSGSGQFQAAVTYNGQGCGSGAYLVQATFTALPSGTFNFGAAAVVLNGTGLVPGLTPQSSFAPNTQGQTVLTDCPTIFNFSTSVNQTPQNCSGIGVVGDINGGSPPPTNTPIPPTATSVPPTPTPTDTLTNTATPTDTPVLPTATSTPVASLHINPVSGVFGQTVVLTGTGFGPRERVNVVAGTSSTAIYSTTTGLAGTFALTSTVRQGPYGPVALIAIGQASKRQASTLFFIKAETLPRTATTVAGGRNVLSGYGFGAHETVKAYWTLGGKVLGQATTNSLGTFAGGTAITFIAPLNPTGTYKVYTVGQTSKAVAVSVYRLTLVQPSFLRRRNRVPLRGYGL